MSIIATPLLYLLLVLLFRVECTEAFSYSPRALAQQTLRRKRPTICNDTAFCPMIAAPRSLKMSEQGTDTSDESSLSKAVLWIGSTTSIFVAGTFFVLLAVKRDALMVSFFMGAISNGILSKILKKVLNQERPAKISAVVKEKPSDKGMPSSHAMSLGFIGMFTALTLPQTQVPVLIYVAMSLYYRVHTQLHTKEQVAVGLFVGILNGALWRSLCSGTNPLLPFVNVMEWVSSMFLNDQGLLPMPLLVVPAVGGLAVVGSFERRIKKWLKRSDNNNNKSD